jgi:hypothetical protein
VTRWQSRGTLARRAILPGNPASSGYPPHPDRLAARSHRSVASGSPEEPAHDPLSPAPARPWPAPVPACSNGGGSTTTQPPGDVAAARLVVSADTVVLQPTNATPPAIPRALPGTAGIDRYYRLTTPADRSFAFDLLTWQPGGAGDAVVSVAHLRDGDLVPTAPTSLGEAGMTPTGHGLGSADPWLATHGDGLARLTLSGTHQEGPAARGARRRRPADAGRDRGRAGEPDQPSGFGRPDAAAVAAHALQQRLAALRPAVAGRVGRSHQHRLLRRRPRRSVRVPALRAAAAARAGHRRSDGRRRLEDGA